MNIMRKLYNWLRGGAKPSHPPIQEAKRMENSMRRRYLKTSLKELTDGNFAILPHVYSVFASPASDLIFEALEACMVVYYQMNITQLTRLDEQFRQTTSVEWAVDWKSVSLGSVLRQCGCAEQAVAFLGFGTFHPNGYYRQKCVEALARYPDVALPFLFLRLNDWVSQVNEAAQEVCEKALQACSPEALLSALPYLQKARMGSRSGRFASEKIRPAIIGRLRQAESKPSLTHALQSSNWRVRRMCLQLTVEAALLSDKDLLISLAHERDPATRLLIVKSLLCAPARANDKDLLMRLLKDKSSAIRVIILKQLYSLYGSAWDGLENYLLDSSARVREYAQFIYRKHRDISPATFYRERLSAAERIPAILGLGETGDATDSELIKIYLNTVETKQVQAVLRSIARISGSVERELYFQYLFDTRPGVAKRAFLCLRDTGSKPNGECLYDALDTVGQHVMKKRLLQLIATLSYWDSLYYLFVCAIREDVGEAARERLQIFRGTFLTPSRSQLERCKSAMLEAKPYLSDGVYREYEFFFAHTRITT